MRLANEHFIFQEDLTPAETIRRIGAVLANPALKNKGIWLDERMDWENFIFWTALEYWINPIWLLVSLQRERSLFGQEGDEKDFDFAQGFVGKHSPGTLNETWNGLPSQLQLAARASSWSLGLRPMESFRRGSLKGNLPSWKRWQDGGIEIELYSDTTFKAVSKHFAGTRAEYVQLVFTPTANWERLLDTNGAIFEKWIAPFYR